MNSENNETQNNETQNTKDKHKLWIAVSIGAGVAIICFIFFIITFS